METEGQSSPGRPRKDLGNFLSGMETVLDAPVDLSGYLLGNFLSGMETPLRPRGASAGAVPLETSLVEWKLASLKLHRLTVPIVVPI